MKKLLLLILMAAGLLASAGTPAEDLVERAKTGDPEAMNYLGYLLISGSEDTDRDVAAGLTWLVKAASAGDLKAASNLGWLYIDGNLIGQNLEKGVKWLTLASGKGLPVASSMLGDLYRDGRGVLTDTAKADSLYRAAFEGGLGDAGYKLYALKASKYESLSPEEKVKEGRYYYMRGAPSEGVKLFEEAAAAGNAEAMAMLGDAYSRAVGVAYDYEKSLGYFARAAAGGNPSAQFFVGELLEIFPDVFQKLEESEAFPTDPSYWYERASEGGVTDAAGASELLLYPQ